jgi:hypothetical protein
MWGKSSGGSISVFSSIVIVIERTRFFMTPSRMGVQIKDGRSDTGMSKGTGVFGEEDFVKILAYLHTVQEK